AVTLTVYLPGARLRNSYSPAPPDLPEVASPLEFLMVIAAPGTTAPVGSVICPRRRPAGDCATIPAERIVTRETARAKRNLDDQGFSKLSSSISSFTAVRLRPPALPASIRKTASLRSFRPARPLESVPHRPAR